MNSDEPLRIADDFVLVEGPTPDGVLVEWPATGRQLRIPNVMFRLLRHFALPASEESVVTELASAGSDQASVHQAIQSLLANGLLRLQLSVISAADSRGLFGSPVVDIATALRSKPDAVVVGAPYDRGASYRAGSKFAPENIRRQSVGIARLSEHRGLWDPSIEDYLGSGLRLVDLGDVPVSLTDPVATFAALQDVSEVLGSAGIDLLMLGGDHSLSLAVINGLAASRGPIGVIHFDAHFDYSQVESTDSYSMLKAGEFPPVHHGNFLGWVIGNPAVRQVLQIGVRQLVPVRPEASSKVRQLSVSQARTIDLDDLVSQLSPDLAWYLTFDVDVLDPSVMPSTGTPLPNGLSYPEALRLVLGLRQRLTMIGLDLVEYIPEPNPAGVVSVCDLLFRWLADRNPRSGADG